MNERSLLITAGISTLGLNVRDIEVQLHQLLVEFRQSSAISVKICSEDEGGESYEASVKSVMIPTSSRVPDFTHAVISN